MIDIFTKNKIFKNYLYKLFIVLFSVFMLFGINASFAQESCDAKEGEMCIDTYTLLEPLGAGATTSYDVYSDGFSSYLSDITRYFFMIIAVIAAFYLIYGGIQYLTVDISSLKLEGKETIKRVIIGLIFIFSIWTIFNAINPDLLKSGVDFGAYTADTEAGKEVPNYTPTGIPSSQTGGSGQASSGPCSSSVTLSGITVCSSIESNLKALLEAGAKDGFNFTGYGLRDPSKQIELRKKNCGTSQYDIYQKPSGQCRPPTARPGTSNHERGEAIDLGISGKTICYSSSPSRASCNDSAYKWLMSNAGKYGFSNNTSEPWHWSKSGY